MLMLAAAAAIVASPTEAPQPRPASALVQATASVRILSSVTIRWNETSADLPRLRLTLIRDANGGLKPIRLIEFE